MRKQLTAIVLITAAGLSGGCNSNRDDSYPNRTRDTTATDSSRPSQRSSTDRRSDTENRSTMDNTGANQYVSPDARILSILHATNQEEIQIGKLAQENGASSEVKRFGEQLVRDHNDLDTKVMSIAKEARISLMDAQEVKQMCAREKGDSSAAKDHVAELRSLRGAEFDRAFGKMMHEGHRDLIQKVESAQQTVREQKVRDLLSQSVEKFRNHGRMASDIMSRTGNR